MHSRDVVVAVLKADDPEPEGVVVATDLKEAALLVQSSERPVLLDAGDLPTIVVAVVIGCRLIRTPPELVGAARRVCDVISAIVDAG